MPDELQQVLFGIRRGRPLVQIASITTERSISRMVDGQGRTVVEIDDDSVHASASGEGAIASSWREIEVELADGGADVGEEELVLLRALAKQLRRAGARPGRASSKLAKALVPAKRRPSTSSGRAPQAGDVVAAFIAEQQRVMLAGDLALRRDDLSVIHKTRVATRRLRSTLRTFTPLFDDVRAVALDAELKWYAELLGNIRDRHVLQARIHHMLEGIPAELILGPVSAQIDEALGLELNEHRVRLQSELLGERYLRLLSAIDSWVAQPPTTPVARKPADKVIARLVDQSEHKVSKRLDRANRDGDVDKLHRARKAAKRARYAAEAAEPVLGGPAAAKHVKRYQGLQDLLGEHQDSRIASEFLRRRGAAAAGVAGVNGFTFGLLYQLEQEAAHRARRQAQRAAKKHRS